MSADAPALTAHRGAQATDAHRAGRLGNPVLGMLLFIASEVMFFASLFGAYFSLRAGYTEIVNGVATHVWPPSQYADLLKPLPLVLPSGALNLIVPATLILITSSLTCQVGANAIRRDDRRRFLRAMSVTLVLGVTFLLLQAYDWSVLTHEGLSPSATTFGTTYFTLTGFHGAHVLLGVVMLAVVVFRGMAGQFSSRHWDMVEAALLYWHFVDVVWILLFSILYLL
jgi:cytochrome c oxidase subunit III